jgi:tetratricopeptide (TPR) repeat protein
LIRSRSRDATLVVVASLLAVATPALADEDREEARRLFVLAERAYAEERWETALEHYTSAYEAAPLPGFLFNIGQCHRKLEHWDIAADFFRRYLEAVPNAPNRADAEELLAEAELRAPPETSDGEAGASRPREDRGEGEGRAPPPPPPAPAGDAGPSIGLPTWISLGAGLLFSGIATAFAFDLSAAQSSFDDDSLDCARRPDRCRDLRDRGETSATLRTVFLVAGLGALAAGGVLLVLDLKEPAEDRPAGVALHLGPGALDAVLTW